MTLTDTEIVAMTQASHGRHDLMRVSAQWLHAALVELRQQRLRNAYILSHGDPWAQSVCRGEHDAALANEKGPPA